MDTKTYWETQPTDIPHYVNGFAGTWNFSDHDLIPNSLTNFIVESFPKVERFKRIPLDEINALMNDVWEGPGSMVKLERLVAEMRANRIAGIESDSKDNADVKTIDDYSDEEKSSFAPKED